jgi:hypothetical protein
MKFMMDDIFMRLSGRYIAGRYFMLPLPLILLLRILLGNRTNTSGNSLALRSPLFLIYCCSSIPNQLIERVLCL